MEFVIRAARIVDSNSPHHTSTKDLLIKNGSIAQIEDEITFSGQEIKASGLKVSPGWVDMRAHYNDPGMEHKEDLETGCNAAASGGFTNVVLLPNTQPVVASKNALGYYQKWNRHSIVQLHPTAAVTLNCDGKELTEMIDLHTAGAVAFTDGIEPIWHTDILLKSLQYLQKFNGLLINRPEDKMLTAFGTMNEGIVSTRLGLKGMPALAEEVMIKRDLQLLEYTGGRIHFSLISTKGAVELLKAAKSRGLKVTADVGIHHLLFTDEQMTTYDTHYKLNPPLRAAADRDALIAGVLDGTIDVIVSDHQPQDLESKKLEYDLAEFGVIGQQSFYPALLSAFGDRSDEVLGRLTVNARAILGLEATSVDVGAKACLTLYSDELSWEYNKANNQSRSEASPFIGQTLKGKVVGTVNNGELALNDHA